MRPELSKQISVQIFKDYYWLKEELQSFCRENEISATGSKMEISNRIETFLLTGEIIKPIRKRTAHMKVQNKRKLSLETVIEENHRCSQEVRAFFKEAIGQGFHFSTYIQNYFKANIGRTYRDVVDAWYQEKKRMRAPSYKKQIAPQFEYNQFIRDFFSDPVNKGRNRSEAIEAWNKIKKLPGNNKYKRSHLHENE